MAIRPERVRLARRGTGGADALPGVVDTVLFVGSTYIHLVRLTDRPEAALQVQTAADGFVPFQKNENVDIILDREALHIFPVTERRAA